MPGTQARHPKPTALLASTTLALLAALGPAHAQERAQPTDAQLDCAGIAAEQQRMKALMDAGQGERTLGTAAAGTAANVGTQVATGQVAAGLFGSLGGLAAKLAGATAQAQTETALGPTDAAREAATRATARHEFLARLADARDCANGGGKPLSAQAFEQLAAAPPAGTLAITPLSAASVAPALAAAPSLLPADNLLDGKVALAGKTVFLTEYRVLFDMSGEVSANTRGGYLLGTDYGATRATVTYKVPEPDIAALQAITDRAYADFKDRLAAAGLSVQTTEPEGGGVYSATEAGSAPGAPVWIDQNVGHVKRRLLVLTPTGTRFVSRGFAGIGAGNIGKRIEWGGKNWEGLSVTQTVNIAELESSGSGSSIWRRGSSAEASSSLTVGLAPGDFLVQTHVGGGLLRMTQPLPVPGAFANFRTVKTFDSDKDTTSRVVGTLQNLMGQGANKVLKVEKEVDVDGPALARLSYQGLASINQAVAQRLAGR